MATTGFRIAGGTDLDACFAARVSAPVAATGFRVAGGTDLNQLYEPRGSTTPRANTGYRIAGGTDLALVFKDISVASNTINIDNANAIASTGGTPPPPAVCNYELTNGGDVRYSNGPSDSKVDFGDWIAPKSNFGLYSVRATLIGGSPSGSPTGVWLNLATTRGWSATASNNSNTVNLLIEIRTDADGIVRDSANVELLAESIFG